MGTYLRHQKRWIYLEYMCAPMSCVSCACLQVVIGTLPEARPLALACEVTASIPGRDGSAGCCLWC